MDALKLWEKYEAGVQYNSTFKPTKNYYESIKVWHNFYDGDQWVGLENSDLPQPVFNITKRTGDFKIASITNSDIAVHIEPLEYVEAMEGEKLDCDFINAEVKNIFEKWNFRTLKKDALRKALITGDMCAHIYFNPSAKPFRGRDTMGEIEVELIDATNVYFGNANIRNVSKQPYVILVGRDTVKNLQAEAKNANVIADTDTDNQLSDFANVEVDIQGDNEGKAKYIYYYEKRDGKVFVTKCTKDAIIYANIDTGYTEYPIAFSNWYKQENTYHGRGEVEGICANQIAINKMMAMIIYHQMMTAFPKAVYDKDVINEWDNEVGTALELKDLKGRNINDVIGYLKPANMSDYIIRAIDLTIQYTKECMGVSDASLGNIDPKNTSAIIAVQKSASVPLENVKDNLYDFVEQIVKILLDVMSAKYGERPVILTGEDGKREVQNYDFSKLKGIDLHLAIDVGESSYFSEIAMLQTLDNLLGSGFIEFIDYLERIPNEMFPKKAEFISKVKEKVAQTNNYEEMAQFVESLPPEEQERLKQLPPEQLEQSVISMMKETP